MDIKIPVEILEAYSPKEFRINAEKTLTLLSEYLGHTSSRSDIPILPITSQVRMLDEWASIGEKHSHEGLITKVIEQSQHIHHPRYIGHQVTAPLPLSAVDGMVTSLLNNSSAVFEMSPVDTIMQKRVIEWMCSKIGYDSQSDGVLTSGGTLGNLTAMLAARQVKGNQTWKKGVDGQKLCVMVSELSHYSIERAVAIMGLGTDSVFKIPVKGDSKIDIEKLDEIFSKAGKAGYRPIALVANAGSTATGCHDNFDELSSFCKLHDLWFHIDGAHGASALVSDKYKYLLNGIEKADSVVWDLHKMMLMPALVTGVLFKDGNNTYQTFLQEASYLFNGDPKSEWFNYAHRTLECTKDMMGLRPYISLQVYREGFFEKYIDYTYDLTKAFADIIEQNENFELGVYPESNIICFRVASCNDEIQQKLRLKIIESGKYYLVQTSLFGKTFLRSTIINPLTEVADLKGLIELLKSLT